MKKILKFLFGLIITAYIAVAVFLTGCLLNLNDYGVTNFGDRTLILIENDEFEPKYPKGYLVISKKDNYDDVNVGDEIFFYNTYKNQISVSFAEVIKKEKINENEATYTVSGDYAFSSQYFIGKLDTSKSYAGVGSILSFLETKMGFLLVVVFPCAMLFMYEIYRVILEIKEPSEE